MSLRTAAYRLALKGMFTLRPERIHGVIHDGLGLLQAVGPANQKGHVAAQGAPDRC